MMLSDLASPGLGLNSADPSLSINPGMLSSLAGKRVKPNFFGKGGDGRRIAGFIGDALATASGGEPLYLESVLNGPQRDLALQLQQAQLDKFRRDAARPQIDHIGNSIGITDQNTGEFKPTYTAPADPTPLERNLAAYRLLKPDASNDELADIAIRGIGGYQYSQPYLQQRQDDAMNLARERGSISLANKQAPSYANTHPTAGRAKASPKPPAGFILD